MAQNLSSFQTKNPGNQKSTGSHCPTGNSAEVLAEKQ
jgi:hypothetical protein